MKRTIERKRERECKVVEEMISFYCKRHPKGSIQEIDGEELLGYARMRIEKCPFMETKTFCSNCRVHCYDVLHREQIRQVMRYSGPRMLFHHPFMVFSHLIESRKEQQKSIKEENKK